MSQLFCVRTEAKTKGMVIYMVLAIDVGNSSISLGAFDTGGRLLFVSGFETELGRARDRCAVDISNIFRLYGYDTASVKGAIISSVVPPVTSNIAAAVEFLIKKPPVIVGPGVKTGINILTEQHTQLGSDLVAAAVGAVKGYKPPVIIIDMGTATTMIAVNSAGALLGCAIMPGVRLGLESLWEHTAQLPRISIEPPKSVIGRNTVDSMRSGILFGTAAMIDGMIERFRAEIGDPALVATGGNAELVIGNCHNHINYDGELVMRGLFEIFVKNDEKT